MMDQMNVSASPEPSTKATLVLGAESFPVSLKFGTLSEQLAVMREKIVVLIKDYITKHNVPNDVSDESIEGLSDDEVQLWTLNQMNAEASLEMRAKATLVVGRECSVSSESGALLEQPAVMRERSMLILTDYITKHNAPNDVPDESIKGSFDDEGKSPPKKSKKQKYLS